MKHARSSRIISVLALVLVATMLMALVGCGDDSKSDDKKTKTTTTVAAATTTTPSDTGDNTTDAPDVDATTTVFDPFATTTAGGTTGGRVTTTTVSGSITEKELWDSIPSELSGTRIQMMVWWKAGTDDTNEAKTFKEKTGIQVSYTTTEMSKYQNVLSSKKMSGAAPALAAIINEWYPQPITRGLMQPISNVKGFDFTDDIYATSMMDQFSYKGKYYGIALKGSNMTTFEVMFYNKDILKENGVTEDPYSLWKKGNWNWDTCVEMAKKCTDIGNNEYGMTLVYQNYWMLSAGQDFVLSDKNGLKNNIKSSKLVEAWNFAWDTINTYKVVDTSFTGQVPFYQHTAAMLGGGSYFMQAESSQTNYVPQNMPEGSWGVVPFPSPKGMTVAACEGTVWGFPETVEGNQLQAAAWFLRYFLDDSNYSDRDFYPTEQCWEVMGWMWNQKIQSFNSVGVLTYGGEYSAASIQYTLIDESSTKAVLKSKLDSWYSVLDSNIDKIENELT